MRVFPMRGLSQVSGQIAVVLGLAMLTGTAPVLGLVVGATTDVVGQHREVIRNDQVVLLICPGPVRHCARLGA